MNLQRLIQRTRIGIAILVAVILTLSGAVWKTPPAMAVEPANQFYAYSVTIEESDNGQVYLSASTNGSVGESDWVALYDHDPSVNVNNRGFDNNYLSYFYMYEKSSQLMGINWRPGLYAIYSSYDYKLGKYVTLAEVGPTETIAVKSCISNK